MIISVLSSIAIWSAVFVIALRIITNSGIALPNNKVISASVSYTHLTLPTNSLV